MSYQRLDKLVASTGKYTRSEATGLIKRGEVLVNGLPVRSGSDKVDTDRDEVLVRGESVGWKPLRYFMLNKPNGVLSATEDSADTTVLDLLPKELQRLGLAPAGRLDKASEGLLLLTNDGAYTHRVISPSRHVFKKYYVETAGCLTQEDCLAVEKGIALSDFTTLPGRLEILEAGESSKAYVYIREGKYHPVRRMLGSRHKPVTFLKRLAIGGLTLDPELKPGRFRELTREEAELVFSPLSSLPSE